jgi:membrane fusion protein, multidrug efflux system
MGLGLALILAASGLALVLSNHRTQQNEPANAAAPVIATAVASGDVPIELEALGRVMASNTVSIRPQIRGQVTAIKYKDGQHVNQGDVLVAIDPRPLQAMVAQDKATLARDRATFASAEADLERYVPLLPQGVVSAQQVSDQRAQVAQRQASVAVDQAALDRDQVQLGYATITAPISGVLGLGLIDVGNEVDPASPTTLVVLTQIQPITIQFPVPQSSLTEIQERQAANSTGLAVQAWLQDGSRQLDQGVLSALSNEVDPATGTVMLKAVFPNPQRSLWPGAAVSVRLVLDVQHGGLTVPATAVNQGPQGPFAWTVTLQGTATMVPLRIRQQLRGQVLLSSGLSVGEQVIIDGQYGLSPGVPVSVQKPSNQASASSLRTNQTGRLGISP